MYGAEIGITSAYGERAMKHRVPIHASRLVYPDSPPAPEMLWEWERPHIDRLLWNATTFGRGVVHCSFLDWDAFEQANQRVVSQFSWSPAIYCTNANRFTRLIN
jgi:hypothetical protein